MVRVPRLVTRSRRSWHLANLSQERREALALFVLSLGFFSMLIFLTFIVSRGALELTASVSFDSRQAFVSGAMACLPGERFVLQMDLMQDVSSTQGSGFLAEVCLGGIQRWTIPITALAGASFAPGVAHACTIGTLYQENSIIDSRQWCQNVVLLRQEGSE